MFIDSFIGYLRSERNYSAHTLRAYAGDLRAFQRFITCIDESLSLSMADKDVVRSWVASLMDAGAAPSSVCRKLSALRSFYIYMRSEGCVESVPSAGVQGPKCRKTLPVFVKESEMDELIDEVSFGKGYVACRDRMMIMCFYETGIRLSELVSLDVADVDMSACRLKVLGKRNKERYVPFADELRGEFESYLQQRALFCNDAALAPLFLSPSCNRISHSSVYRAVKSRLSSVSAVKKRSPHVLRHSFATAMLNNEAEIGVVKELLGHSRLATTEVYTHLTFEELKRFYDKAHPRAGNN